jgi:1-acyl-sn-glycerol-3-phosphate acyltransferase
VTHVAAPYAAVASASYPAVRLGFRTRWRGAENVPRRGGAVVASNHLSNFDPFPLALGLYPRRQFRFMAKRELFRFPLGQLLSLLGCFPVDRGRPDRSALATAVRLCRDGQLLLMFPEGTRRAKGLRKRFDVAAHAGAAWIALKAGVPLVPAAVAGTDRLSRLGPIRVAYGAPLDLGDLAGAPTRQAAVEATERLMTRIGELEAEIAG